jgi:ABC-type branched-subunit amino acid transport system substrate-binding protein
MKVRTSWLWLIGLAIAAMLLLGACEEDSDDDGNGGETPSTDGTPSEGGEIETDFGVTDSEITLGMTIAKSGNAAAALFQPLEPAMQAYFEKVNTEDGGVCGRTIAFITEDDQYAPAPAQERAQKLAEQDEVVAFVGNLGTAAVSGQVEYINDPDGDGDTEDGIPHLFLSTGAHKWGDTELYPWTIGYIPDYTAEGAVLATYMNENFAGQTAAILYQNDDFGEDGRSSFAETLEAEVVEEQSYEAGAPDVTSQLATLRAADPDILFLYSLPLQTAQVFTYMEANNWNPQVVWSYVNPSTLLADLTGGPQAIEGVISTNYLLDPVADVDAPAMVEHKRIMDTYEGGDVAQLTIYGQSLAEIAVETLQRACDNGDMTRAGVLAAAESLEGYRSSVLFEGIDINLSENDHIAIEALVPVQVQADGTLQTLGETIDTEDGGASEDEGDEDAEEEDTPAEGEGDTSADEG